jgi:hypothetical protein
MTVRVTVTGIGIETGIVIGNVQHPNLFDPRSPRRKSRRHLSSPPSR